MEILTPSPVDVLTLGTGWVGTYLTSELESCKLRHASTSRDGNDGTIPFAFDPSSYDPAQYVALPTAETVVIIFPIIAEGGHKHIVKLYNDTHPGNQARWVQLGSTSAFDVRSIDFLRMTFRDDKNACYIT
jgi:hypothetical protein